LRQGRPEEAVACYQQSLAADPRFDRVHLSLAAAYLEMDDPKAACAHLGLYLQGRPDHLLVRAQYAELLHRLERPAEARVQFERFVADSQDCGDLHNRYLIHCHTRLMEIAEDEASDYDEYLHRGIGLWLLARQRLTLPDPEGQLSVQGLLCKAAGELTQARQERPDEARPCWYLYQVWTQLGQRQPALRWLRQAESAAPFSYLTPAEKGRLYLACRDLEEGSWK
jgi:tetratricopeptide (TPR) repeat protein